MGVAKIDHVTCLVDMARIDHVTSVWWVWLQVCEYKVNTQDVFERAHKSVDTLQFNIQTLEIQREEVWKRKVIHVCAGRKGERG